MSTTSGLRSAQSETASSPFVGGPDELDVGEGREELCEPGADDGVVVGDHDPDHASGTSRTNDVPAPGVERTSSVPSMRAASSSRSERPTCPSARLCSRWAWREAGAVVRDLQPSADRLRRPTLTETRVAPAWRSTLRIASPAAR